MLAYPFQKPCRVDEDILKTLLKRLVQSLSFPFTFHSRMDTKLSHSLSDRFFGGYQSLHSVELYLLRGVIISLVHFLVLKNYLSRR